MSAQNSNKTFLSTQGYRGTRDFFPDDMRLKSYIYEKIHLALKSFGYEEYDGPFVEPLELYASKTSEEIVRDQLYSFVDKGERQIAIRPEMTPTLARMVAAKHRELMRPMRWYSIPTCMRFERPQRGRLREFDQLNVDIFGGNPLDEDIEVLLTAAEILKKLGASLTQFVIKINHRGIVNSFLKDVLHIDIHNITLLLRLLDKREKLKQEVFMDECVKLNLNATQIDQLEEFLNADLNTVVTLLNEHEGMQYASQIKLRIDTINKLLDCNCAVYTPTIMRGFDYYTGMVFEIFDTNPQNLRALGGGGRYDNLVGSFGAEELSGVGYGMGDVGILNFLESNQLKPMLKKQVHICVVRFSEQERDICLKLATALRSYNLNIENTVSLNKFGKQIQNAEKSGAKVVVFCGEDELKSNSFAVKWLTTGLQEVFKFDKIGLDLFYGKFLTHE